LQINHFIFQSCHCERKFAKRFVAKQPPRFVNEREEVASSPHLLLSALLLAMTILGATR
jgi:hypothetical protein